MPKQVLAPAVPHEHRHEYQLLKAGLPVKEIAAQLGVPPYAIYRRNRRLYHVDLQSAFMEHQAGSGYPKRELPDPAWCGWLSGFIDGDGSLGVATKSCQVELQVELRASDLSTLEGIHNTLKIGNVRDTSRAGLNPRAEWGVKNISEIVEVILPLLERHPLHTKKAEEFIYWSWLAKMKYISSRAGTSRESLTSEQRTVFQAGAKAIRALRVYH